MNQQLPSPEAVTNAQARDLIDDLCDRFETGWMEGKRPDLVDYLDEVSLADSHHALLARELLVVDIDYRRARGEQPAAKDYVRRLDSKYHDSVFELLPSVTSSETIAIDADVSIAEFASNLAASGLVEDERLASIRQKSQAGDGSATKFARELVDARLLTAYQANLVAAGRSKQLVLGQYTILDELGKGGMGIVYRAIHRRMHREVAIKVLAPDVLRKPEVVERFYREVQAAAKLLHPNIVTAFDADEHDGQHYLVMEYVQGEDLSRVLARRGPLPIARAVDYTLQAARGLQFAHEKNLVHRDIKPANLLVDESGAVKILDMGLARIRGDGLGQTDAKAPQLTQSGQIMGTVDYMAPEQAEDIRTADHRADIYSLGCTLHRLITGRPLFQAETLLQRILAHRDTAAPPLRELRRHVPEELNDVFQRMVAKNPDDRQQSMNQVIDELRACPLPQDDDAVAAAFAKTAAGSDETATNAAAVANTDTFAAPSAPKPATRQPAASVSATPKPSGPQVAKTASAATAKWLGSAIAVGVLALLAAAAVIFVQLPNGATLRVEINDPDIEVAVKGTQLVLRKDGENETLVEPGEKTLIVSRGPDFSFEVEKLVVKKGQKTTLLITFVDSRIDVKEGERVLHSETLPSPPSSQPPSAAPPAPVKTLASWPKGPTDNVLPGLVRAPRNFDAIGRWQIRTLDGRPGVATWNPDGKLVAVPISGMIEVVNADTRKRVFAASGNVHQWSPDGKWLAVIHTEKQMLQIFGRDGSTVKIKEDKPYFGSDNDLLDVRWSPTSDRVAVIGEETAMISPETGFVATLEISGRCTDAHWSKDGQRLVTNGPKFLVWDRAGAQVGEEPFASAPKFELHPDGKHILALRGGLLECDPLLTEPLEDVQYLAWSPDEKLLAVAVGEGITLLDRQLKPRQTLTITSKGVKHFAWRPDGTGLLTMSFDGVTHYVPSDGEEPVQLDMRIDWNNQSHHRRYFDWSSDGSRAVVALFNEGLWKFEGQTPTKLSVDMLPGYGAHFCTWSPAGSRFLLSRSVIGGLQMYDADGNALASLTNDQPRPAGCQVSPHSDLMGVVVDGKRIDFFSLDGVYRSSITPEGGVRFFEWHPDGEHLVYGTFDKKFVHVYHVASRKTVARTEGGGGRRIGATAEPTKGDVIAVLKGHEVLLWRWKVDRVPRTRIPSPIPNYHQTDGIDWSPDGKSLLFLSDNDVPVLTDLEGNVQARFDEAKQSPNSRWSEDGKYVEFYHSLPHSSPLIHTRGGEFKGKGAQGGPLGISPDGQECSEKWTLDGELFQPYEGNPSGHGVETADGRYLVLFGRIWSTSTRELLCEVKVLSDRESVTLGPGGDVLHSTSPAARDQLVYVVEEPDGAKRRSTTPPL